MTTATLSPVKKIQQATAYGTSLHQSYGNRACSSWLTSLVWTVIKIRMFYFACILLRKPAIIKKTLRKLLMLRRNVWGGHLNKMYRVNGKYYFNMYAPGWPSRAHDYYLKDQLKRQSGLYTQSGKPGFVFLAITGKCPMRCEHCFEWENLNKKEAFTTADLLKVADTFIEDGVQQFHFTGGEPMMRLNDLLQLIAYTKGRAECWVVSSGYNVTEENARKLKAAGCKGIAISVDHYIPLLHNTFRGNEHAFAHATHAIWAAQKAGLITAMSVCTTKEFIEGNHMLPYMQLAKHLGVQFVQWLEPSAIGHYKGMDVLLQPAHIKLLEELYVQINHQPAYQHYPAVMYHGYYQRLVGCFSGSRQLYIDAAGNVNACPFCHTQQYNILNWMKTDSEPLPEKLKACPKFGKTA